MSHRPATKCLGYCGLIAGGAALTVMFLQLCDGYQVPTLRSAGRAIPRLIGCWTLAFASMTLVLFLLKTGETFSRLSFGGWYVLGAVFLIAERAFIAFSIRRWARNGIMERRAVIVGGGQPAKDLIRSLEQQTDNDIRICGIFDDRDERRSPGIIAGYPKLGTVAELVDFARLTRIDILIIALPLSAEKRILELLRKLWILPADIRLAAHANNLRFRPRKLFACRPGADARYFRQADRRLGIRSPSASSTCSSASSPWSCSGRSSSAPPSPSR